MRYPSLRTASGHSSHICDTPVGRLELWAGVAGLCRIRFLDPPREGAGAAPRRSLEQTAEPEREASADECALLQRAGVQLAAYFAGELCRFTLPLDLRGSPFQRAVWQALLELDYGATTTYRALAAAAGRPAAVRAAGAANGANPLPIIVPCHRVTGSNGTLTGYGGGLAAKRYLRELEGRTLAG